MLQVNEIFCSPQGEGAMAGIPMVFVRLFRCNLDCPWCDQPSALDTRPGRSWREMEEDEVVEAVRSYGVPDVCVTGGEPFVQHAPLRRMLEVLASEEAPGGNGRWRVTVETNGTMYLPEVVAPAPRMEFFLSMSPKTVGGPLVAVSGGARSSRIEMHGQRDVLQWIRDPRLGERQLKFVVESEDHMTHLAGWLLEHVGGEDARRIHLCFQPEWYRGRDGFREVLKKALGNAPSPLRDRMQELLRMGWRSLRFLPQGHKALGMR